LKKRKIAVLGSTGSIGVNALQVLEGFPEEFEVVALAAHSNTNLLLAQAERFHPAFLAVAGKNDETAFSERLPAGAEAGFGPRSLIQACAGADLVLLAVLGIAGLPPFEYCLRNGIPVAFATKEALVCGGRLARELMDSTRTPVLPIDSELSAIFQCLQGNERNQIRQIFLTASGGPFRKSSPEEMRKVTVADALKHPNWKMGKKITVDCATMINKGLEVMETRWLFDIPPEKITVVVHPESVIHSMVEYEDGAIMAQLGPADMKIAIAYALTAPRRRSLGVEPLSIVQAGSLHFEEPDFARFPCLRLAYEAIRSDDYLQLVVNSANEAAVELFLQERIGFSEIPELIERAMNRFGTICIKNFDDIYEADREIRAYCRETAQ